MLEIKNSTAVITGAAGGIGRALAEYWLSREGRALLADIDDKPLSDLKKQYGGSVETISCDVMKEEDCSRLAARAIEAFGSINLVAPCAGIIKDSLMVSPDRETGKVTGKMSLADFKKVIDINLTGVFLTVRECAEQMINSKSSGLICLISSTGSLGTAGQINYSSSKAAMSVFPKVLTAEFFRRAVADRIRCVAVAPGYVGTPMVKGMKHAVLEKIIEQVPIRRLIEPIEIASFIIELYRNEAIAGDVYFIHGGLRLGSKG